MRRYSSGIFAIVLAIGFSAYRPYDNYLTVNTSQINYSNVASSLTYSNNIITCEGASEGPCMLDLTLINPTYWVTDEESFLAYLITQFPTPAARVSEVNRITIEWKN